MVGSSAAATQVVAEARLVALVLAEAGNFPAPARFCRREAIGRGLTLVAGILDGGMASGGFRRLDADVTARPLLIFAALWRASFAPVEEGRHEAAPPLLLALALARVRRARSAGASVILSLASRPGAAM